MIHRRRAILALLAASITTTTALPQGLLALRASDSSPEDYICPKDYRACPSSLPASFCCSASTSCMGLAANTTAICCPSGNDCSRIEPIACDARLQDPSAHPTAPVFTTVFSLELAACSNGCCPFGYACDGGQCLRDADQSKTPAELADQASSRSGTASATATTTTTTTDASTTTTTTTTAKETHTTTTKPPAESSSSSSSSSSAPARTASTLQVAQSAAATATATADPGEGSAGTGATSKTTSIIGGAVGGAGVLVIATAIGILCVRRRRKKQDPNDDASSSSSSSSSLSLTREKKHGASGPPSVRARGLQISDPIIEQDSFRTDFMLKRSPSAASSISQRPVNSRWEGDKPSSPPQPGASSSPRNLTRGGLRPPQLDPVVGGAGAGFGLSVMMNPFASPTPLASPGRGGLASPGSCYDFDGRHWVDGEADDEAYAKTGEVSRGLVAPPVVSAAGQRVVSRNVEPQHMHGYGYYDEKEEEEEGHRRRDSDVFSDQYAAVPPLAGGGGGGGGGRLRDTTFSGMMQDAGLGAIHRGEKNYVPMPDRTPNL